MAPKSEEFLHALRRWAQEREDVLGVALKMPGAPGPLREEG
jgi:hypothetical protein